jgi:hypothetical protein
MAGLRMTGQFDEQTVKLMHTPRCGVADVDTGADRRSKRYAIGPSKWENKALSFRCELARVHLHALHARPITSHEINFNKVWRTSAKKERGVTYAYIYMSRTLLQLMFSCTGFRCCPRMPSKTKAL